MEFNGVPLHPLVVHAAVVFVPLAALATGVYGVVPRWRWLLRWPMVVAGLLAAGTVQLADASGESLRNDLDLHTRLIQQHEMWAGRLLVGTWVLAVVVLVAGWLLPSASPLPGRRGTVARLGVLTPVLAALLPLVALIELYLVFRTGDAGAKAVWAGA